MSFIRTPESGTLIETHITLVLFGLHVETVLHAVYNGIAHKTHAKRTHNRTDMFLYVYPRA